MAEFLTNIQSVLGDFLINCSLLGVVKEKAFSCYPFLGGGSVVVESLFIVAPTVGGVL